MFIIISLLAALIGRDNVALSAPSFSCENPGAVEKLICDNEDLSAKDRLLAQFFSIAKKNDSGVVVSQREWLADRNKRCASPPDEQCVAGAYDNRLFDLAVANLLSDHDGALNEIARQAPKLADIYEAIYAFATIKTVDERTERVASLIADAYRETAFVPQIDFSGAGATLPAKPQQLYADIPDAKSAASSSEKLGVLLWVVSAFGYGGRPVPLVIPCIVLLKHPESVDWLTPRWGGAIDGMTPRSDCAETLPRLPTLGALIGKAGRGQASEGTIRFSLGASASADYSAVLTENVQFLSKYPANGPLTERVDAFEKKNSKSVEAAIGELADYYQKNFGVTTETARRDANVSVSAMLAVSLSGGL
jgi:uncharacterized protein